MNYRVELRSTDVCASYIVYKYYCQVCIHTYLYMVSHCIGCLHTPYFKEFNYDSFEVGIYNLSLWELTADNLFLQGLLYCPRLSNTADNLCLQELLYCPRLREFSIAHLCTSIMCMTDNLLFTGVYGRYHTIQMYVRVRQVTTADNPG